MENELIKRFEQLLQMALNTKSTDISFNVNENGITISLRFIGGVRFVKKDPLDLALLNMLKYQAHLDICSNKPQSGSFEYCYEGVWLNFRLASVGFLGGSNSVLRILNDCGGLKIEQLCENSEDRVLLKQCLTKRSGLILFGGLTGSGKTTSMYALLNAMKNRAIYSLEDPVEIHQKNVIQLQINEKIGFDYDEGIKQILRHNPDVLMIGEIRDEKTAKMTVRAALSGCLVLSSIHASSPANTLTRLVQLGVPKEELKDILWMVFNQRLFRKKGNKGYTAIYDHIDNQKVRCLLDGGTVNTNMNQKIKEAADKGIIEKVNTDE